MGADDRLKQVLKSVPVDETARRVISRGIHYDAPVKIDPAMHSKTPFPVTSSRQPHERDQTGLTFGRFVVIGKALNQGTGKNAKPRWVVRCSCGSYEYRSVKAMKNVSNNADMCVVCRHLVFRKRNRHFFQTGEDRPSKDFA